MLSPLCFESAILGDGECTHHCPASQSPCKTGHNGFHFWPKFPVDRSNRKNQFTLTALADYYSLAGERPSNSVRMARSALIALARFSAPIRSMIRCPAELACSDSSA